MCIDAGPPQARSMRTLPSFAGSPQALVCCHSQTRWTGAGGGGGGAARMAHARTSTPRALDPALAAMLVQAKEEDARAATHHSVYTTHVAAWQEKYQPTVKQAVWHGSGLVMSVVPFSWQDAEADCWDRAHNSGILSAHWPLCPNKIDITLDGAAAAFHTVDAAYQAQKWWGDVQLRGAFERCMTARDVQAVKAEAAGRPRRPLFDRDDAMLRALVARYQHTTEAEPLLATRGAFLLCVSREPVGAPGDYWGDGNGVGQNRYGLLLMAVREHLTQAAQPMGGTSSWPPMLVSGGLPEVIAELAWFVRDRLSTTGTAAADPLPCDPAAVRWR